jgi:hypothetical protein
VIVAFCDPEWERAFDEPVLQPATGFNNAAHCECTAGRINL